METTSSFLAAFSVGHADDCESERRFAWNSQLRSLFDAPTIAQLSALVEALPSCQLEAMSEEEVQRLLEAATDAA